MRYTLILCCIACLFASAQTVVARGSKESPPPALPVEQGDELPELARVGGVQDIWPFRFGLNDGREAVRAELGEPSQIELVPVVGDSVDQGPFVERWRLDGINVAFYVDPANAIDYILTVEVAGRNTDLGQGVRVGMSVEEALAVFGKPTLERDGSLIYFYLDTTIQLAVTRGEVTSLVLARAMP